MWKAFLSRRLKPRWRRTCFKDSEHFMVGRAKRKICSHIPAISIIVVAGSRADFAGERNHAEQQQATPYNIF